MENTQIGITINVGDLSGISSVFGRTKEGLAQFNQLWKQGQVPVVTWDLRELRTGKINVGATSFFLALAQRVRSYSNHPLPILIDWHPKKLGFLFDIGFFEIAYKYDLFKWPYAIGGFEGGTTNPNTLLTAFDELSPSPNFEHAELISNWKREHREAYRGYLIELCESLFKKSDRENFGFSNELPLIISRTCSELVTNSLLWGGNTAFVGLQRTSKGILISVSDIGIGMRLSLYRKDIKRELISESKYADLNAMLICSTINEKDFGLKRAISSVVDIGGNITIISNSSEIRWSQYNWQRFNNEIRDSGINNAVMNFNMSNTGNASFSGIKDGYSKKWDSPIRGTRITFYIPTMRVGGL